MVPMTQKVDGKKPLYELLLRFPYPEYKKGRLATMNSMPNWYRYSKTQIKKKLLDFLNDWVLPKPQDGSGTEMTIEFTIMRHNKKRIDADSIAMVSKWVCDFIVIKGYLQDDDRTTFIYHPAIYSKDITSTEVECKISIY